MSDPVPRRGGLTQPALLIVADLVALEAAFLLAWWFRFHARVWPTPLGVPPLGLYLGASVVILAVFFGLFYARGLYGRVTLSFEEELSALFRGVIQGSLLVLALTFFLKRETFSRSFFGLFFLSCLLFLVSGRAIARRLLRRLRRRGVGLRRALLVGDSPMRERTVRTAHARPELGLLPVGWVAAAGEPPAPAAAAPPGVAGEEAEPVAGGLPCLGVFADLPRLVEAHAVDLVVLTLPFAQLGLVARATEELAGLQVDVQLVPDLLALRASRLRLTEMGGVPFFGVRESALSGADRIVKRSFDVVCTALGLLLLLPAILLLALLVRLGSPGPVFYRQARVGRDGHEFDMLKFRTMRVDAEAGSGPVWTVAADPRVTRVGRWLRRLSLDELPQLWNVLRGDMSLVGPRPERQMFVEQFSRRLPRYFERHRVRSGLTGWAQVNGLRGNTSIEERTLYDLHYVENWSLGLDVKILLMTIHHVLRGENAY